MREMVKGPAGFGWRIDEVPDTVACPDKQASLAGWLMTLPGQAAMWNNYVVATCHLRSIPGVKPPVKDYPEAEYEVVIYACDPERNPRPDDLNSLLPLLPLNLSWQFHGCGDEKARDVARYVAEVLVAGAIPAEPSAYADNRLWDAMLKTFLTRKEN